MRTVIGHAVRHQVAFVGPFGVGKTTAVHAVSDTDVVNTDVSTRALPRPGSPRKATTTVGIDYGEWTTPAGVTIGVYGTPGQERFSPARRGAATKAHCVLWLFGNQPYGVDEGEEWLGYLGADSWRRLTVAVSRLGERKGCPDLAAYGRMAHRFDKSIPVVAADPRERDDVERVVLTALRGADRRTARKAASA
ncbi:MAG TPA: hypothetical protein P5181_08675 [Dermatophilaceae bacterium]|nr:hypothetical protein [Dermatophilaceae bacterium]